MQTFGAGLDRFVATDFFRKPFLQKEIPMAKRIVIDEDECEGCETCVELCPNVFAFDDDAQKARVIDPESKEDCVEEAMDSCPVECISWEED